MNTKNDTKNDIKKRIEEEIKNKNYDIDNKEDIADEIISGIINDVSDEVRLLLIALNTCFDGQIEVLGYDSYENEDVEVIETQIAIFTIDRREGKKILGMNLNIECKINIVLELGLYLASLHERVFDGFKFMENYFIQNTNDKVKYCYGEEAEEEYFNTITKQSKSNNMNSYYMYQILKNADIDKIPSC